VEVIAVRSLIAALLVLGIAGGCNAATESDTSGTAALSGSWRWVSSRDADGSVYAPDSVSAGHRFAFREDGSFVEDYPGGCCEYAGTWALSDSVLTLSYTDQRRNGQTLSYRVLELGEDGLVLGARGRHGTVTESYARIRHERWDE
jgi:hypothetical protein